MRRDPMRDGFAVAAIAWCLAIVTGLVAPGVDAHQYWLHRLPDPYDITTYGDSLGGYWYPPPFAQLIYPLTLLPLGVFSALVTGAGFLALFAVLGRWAWAGLLFPPVWWDLTAGNVNTIIGAAILLSVRSPLFALVPAFTKVTPGITALWFIVRGEWRTAARLTLIGVLVVAVSVVLSPALWIRWGEAMLGNAGYLGPGYFTIEIPLLPRLVASTLIVIFAARTGRAWLLPIAGWLAIPVLWWSTMGALIAVVGKRKKPLPPGGERG